MPRKPSESSPNDAALAAHEAAETPAPPQERLERVTAAEAEAARAEAAEAAQAAVEEVAEETASVVLPPETPDAEVARIAAALVFASDKPLSAGRLAELLGLPASRIRAALDAFSERIAAAGVPFHIVEIAGGLRFSTLPDLAPYVSALRGEQKKERLSSAALETLAIVAYRQPVTKAEIEAMRGVQAGPILRTLLDRRLIRVTGRAPVPGRPLQYGTTKEFLDRFQLASLKDLPTVEELVKP